MSTKMIVAYSRVSTIGQNTDRQTIGLKGLATYDRMYEDKVSGVIPFAERPAGRRLIQDVNKGLVASVYVWEVSRIGRDLPDIHRTIQFFVDNRVQLIIHNEGISLLTADGNLNPAAQLVLSVMAALSQIERTNIRERTMQGIQVAKVNGKYLGRRRGTSESPAHFLAKPKSKRITEMLSCSYPVSHIARILGVSPTTVNKVKALNVATATVH